MSSLAKWPQWLNSLSSKLGPEMKGLLRASYCGEFDFGRLENLDESGLYQELSRDRFTDIEAQNLLIRRLFLLEEAGTRCIKSLAKYGLEVPTSAPHVDGLTQQSELVECFVHTLAILTSVERKHVLDYLAKTQLEVDPSNLSNMEIICALFHKRKICVDDITPLIDAFQSISTGTERDVYDSLNGYCAKYSLPSIQTCGYPTQVSAQYGAAIVIPSSGHIHTPNLVGQQPAVETQTTDLDLHWTAHPPQPHSTLAGSSSHFATTSSHILQPLAHESESKGNVDETQRDGGLRKTTKCVCCILAIILIIVLIVGILALSLYLKTTEKTIRGIEGDFLYLDITKSLWYAYWSARECLKIGDSTHTSSLYLVSENDLIKYVKDIEQKTPEIHAPDSSRKTGTISTTGIYMLNGSYIDYQLCLASTSSREQHAKVFVFDYIENYLSFVDGVTTGYQNSIYHEPIPIGSSNTTECSTLRYTVTKPAYYFLTAETPAQISYMMNATLHIVYLNHSDYSERCEVTQSENCKIRIPSTLFCSSHYILLEYIHPPGSINLLTTHTCLTHSSRLFHYVIVYATIEAVISIIILLFVILCKMYRVNRRTTYERLDSA